MGDCVTLLGDTFCHKVGDGCVCYDQYSYYIFTPYLCSQSHERVEIFYQPSHSKKQQEERRGKKNREEGGGARVTSKNASILCIVCLHWMTNEVCKLSNHCL